MMFFRIERNERLLNFLDLVSILLSTRIGIIKIALYKHKLLRNVNVYYTGFNIKCQEIFLRKGEGKPSLPSCRDYRLSCPILLLGMYRESFLELAVHPQSAT